MLWTTSNISQRIRRKCSQTLNLRMKVNCILRTWNVFLFLEMSIFPSWLQKVRVGTQKHTVLYWPAHRAAYYHFHLVLLCMRICECAVYVWRSAFSWVRDSVFPRSFCKRDWQGRWVCLKAIVDVTNSQIGRTFWMQDVENVVAWSYVAYLS